MAICDWSTDVGSSDLGFDEGQYVLLPISPDERPRRAHELDIRHWLAISMDREMIFEADVEVDDRGYRPRLVTRLEEETRIGKGGTLAAQLSRLDLLVLDALGYLSLDRQSVV